MGYEAVTFAHLIDGWEGRAPLPRKPVCITFDDGLACVFEHAAPILGAMGWPATVFVPSAFVGARAEWFGDHGREVPQSMTAAQCAELFAHRWEMSGHCRTHPHLSRLTDADALAEIRGGAEELGALVGSRVRTFCYPYGDLGERTSLSQYRFVCAMIAQLLIQGLALPMVHFFGGADSAKGYQYTIGIFSAVAVGLFLITFATTKERIQPEPDQKAPVRQHFADLTKNGPWIAMFVLTFILFITLSMRGSVVLYYFKYYVQKRLAMGYGKRAVFMWGLAGTALFTAVFFVLPPSAVAAMFAAEMLRQFVYGFTIPLLWAMMADVADYSEWKNHRRATGIVFAAIVFALKAGLGFGGAITGFVLSLFGYVPNVAQTPHALDGIRYTMSIFPAITFAICAGCLLFYRIDKAAEIRITDELAERRKGFTALGS